jgi:hypothetical protein
MVRRIVSAAFVLSLSALSSFAQQPGSPIPLYLDAPPGSIQPEPLPPIPPTAGPTLPAIPTPLGEPPLAVAPAAAAPGIPSAMSEPISGPASAPMSAPTGRVFCEQPVTVRLVDPDAVAERYRPFIGIWSDASWTPQLCAALIVENITPEGTASIVYAFGPMTSTARGEGGVLHGTGIIRDGALSFQNSDGSQFVFRPLYADLDGHLTTPQGQSYKSIFKKTP